MELGEELYNAFREPEDAQRLAAGGEIRGISDGTIEYYKDIGGGFRSKIVDTIEDAKSEMGGGSYMYIYDPDLGEEGWMVQYIGNGWQGMDAFVDLGAALHSPRNLPGY